jgi:cytochrome o ubiquinol oxidase subunit II
MNTQYNGNGCYSQHFKAVAMTPPDFDGWVKTVRQNGVALSEASYKRLARGSTSTEVHSEFGDGAMPKDVTFFNEVTPKFFERIVSRYHSGKAVSPPDARLPYRINEKLKEEKWSA